MKVIELLNKIANGEEVPKRIKYNNKNWNYKDGILEYISDDTYFCLSNFEFDELNDEVEIIKEKEMCHKCHKYPVEYNQTYCEFCLGISKLKEHKIPEKLDTWFSMENAQNNGISKEDFIIKYANYNFETYFNKINEIIDYLEEENGN